MIEGPVEYQFWLSGFKGGGRFTEQLRLEGTSGGQLVQPSCSSRVNYSWLSRTKWLL